MGSLLVWGVAAVAFYLISGSSAAGGGAAAESRKPLPPELAEKVRRFDDKSHKTLHERGIELPRDTLGVWYGEDPSRISAEARRRTLDFAASEEGRSFFARNRERLEFCRRIAAEAEFIPEISLPYLQHYRSVARRCAAESALAFEAGKNDEVLPPLEAAETLEATLYDCETALIEGLVRIALAGVRINAISQCGPEGPEYAPRYRAMLARALAREATVPSEADFLRPELARIRRFENGRWVYGKGTSFYARLISWPATCAKLTRALRQAESNARSADEMRRSGTVPASAGSYGEAMRRALGCRALEISVLALKIHRCEKGSYPAKLDELVPGILRELPLDPTTGRPPRYSKSPEGVVELSLAPAPSRRNPSLPVVFAPRY